MHQQTMDTATEVRRLQRSMSDLVSILALPAVWSASEPSLLLETLADALMGILDLDLVYVRGRIGSRGAPVGVLKTCDPSDAASAEIRQALNSCFGEDPRDWREEELLRMGERELPVFPIRMGIEGDVGLIVAGSRRLGFPEQTENLVLRVAANQAAIGLQQAIRLDEQRRLASELDRRVSERTRELAEANEELRLQVGLLQHLPVSAWTLKPDGTPDFVNQVWLDFSGQTLKFVRSHPEAWMAALHPEDRESASAVFWKAVQAGQSFAMETRSRRAQDGTYRWHLQQAVALRDAEGKVIRFVGTTTDIDDQKRAQEALKASEAGLVRVIDTIPTLSWSMFPDGPNEFLSKRWHDYTGLSVEESRGWAWQTAFHPDDLPNLMEKWKEMLAAGEPGEQEARIRRYDGVYRWFLIRAAPFRDDSGNISRWYGTSTDIDDRKRAEDAVLANERNLGLIISTMPVLAWSAQSDGKVDFFNQRWLDYTGLSLAEARDWGWARVFHPEDLATVDNYWRSRIERGEPGEIEARLRRFDGSFRWFLFRANPLRAESGEIVKWYGTNTDIDDRKRAEEELRNTQAELARMMRVMTVGQLTASITHEINQPLSGIVTNASTCLRMLKADPPDIHGAMETAQRTIRDSNRASEVITRLRTLFSKKEIDIAPLDLNEAAREVIALLSSELQKSNVVVRLELSDPLPFVNGDRVQLQQVILNLIRNASDAMSCVVERPRQIVVRTELEGDQVRLSVQDAGVGLTPEIANQMFESFFTTKSDGMGVGLSVSRSIIEANHGRLWATANDGTGATFTFSVPCARMNASEQSH